MKVLFCGDLSPTSDNAALFEQADTKTLFADTAELFSAADYSLVNLECALVREPTPIRKIGPAIGAPLGTAQVLKQLGVTHCGLANNHIFDMGPKGIASTLAALEQAGIGYTGFGDNEADSLRDLVLEKNGTTLCVIAVCEHEYSYALKNRMGCRAFDPFETPLQVRAAKERYDRVAVLYHGGKEQCRYPSPRLVKACRAMAQSGADLVLCQHSHCIGCYEEFAGCHILYGQGNFHFVKEARRQEPSWHQGLAVCYDTESGRVTFVPVVDQQLGIRLADPREAGQILEQLTQRSAAMADGSWQQGWREFCLEHQAMYTSTVAKAYSAEGTEFSKEKFAHYLDCEAHQDVWRELFPTCHHTDNWE